MKAQIVQVLVLLSASAAAQAQFKANPQAFLTSAGLGEQARQVVMTCDTDAIRQALGDVQTVAISVQSPF